MLGEKAIQYRTPEQLTEILKTFTPTDKDWNAYQNYSPEKVMQIFKKIFL